MKLDNNNKKVDDFKVELKSLLNESKDKTDAIIEAIDKYNSFQHAELISEIKAEAELANQDASYKASLGLRNLSQKEKDFYEFLKNHQSQSITANQIDIIPEDVIDYTLENIKAKSRIKELISFAPSKVKKWFLADKSGKAVWGKLTDEITNELSVSFETIDYELGKLMVILIIPKSIRDLSYEFVDRYFTAILEEALNDGIEDGYLYGTGVDSPIGVFKKVDDFNSDKTAKDKEILTNITNFSPKGLSDVLVKLTNNGKRSVSTLYIVCNPVDKFNYIMPALYGETRDGYAKKSAVDIEIIDTSNCKKGQAGFTLKDYYSMGFSGIKINEYKETKALEDADLIVGKAYGNGRALDNNVFIPFDPTKLEEYIPKIEVVEKV